jgi:hypothetical protein
MSSTLSLRRMWTMYKKLLIEDGMSRRDQVLAQGAFYSGARPGDQVSEKTIRHRLAAWYAHQSPEGHPLLN